MNKQNIATALIGAVIVVGVTIVASKIANKVLDADAKKHYPRS